MISVDNPVIMNGEMVLFTNDVWLIDLLYPEGFIVFEYSEHG
jgi:hypothetical protein